MRNRLVSVACLVALTCALATVHAQRPRPARPDLIIREYQFAPTNDKGLRVRVANIGTLAAGASVLRLTIRKINGASVARTMDMPTAAIPAQSDVWVTFIADGILPKDVDIKNTTFKLNADATTVVSESNETNNEKWHNL